MLVVLGWENCFRLQLEKTWCQPGRTSFFSERRRATRGTTPATFRYGLTTATTSCMEFPEIRTGASKSPMTLAGPSSIPPMANGSSSQERLKEARLYVAFRFPGMKDAPVLETRVCQYENTPDHDYILDRHPTAGNVWIAGGGRGTASRTDLRWAKGWRR